MTSVLPRPGKFANDPKLASAHPPADLTIECIGDLLDYAPGDLLEEVR